MSRLLKKRAKPENTAAKPSGMAVFHDRWMVLGICVFLAAIIWGVFGQTLHHEFINFDDNVYVYENPRVVSGLTLHGVGWMFTHSDCNFYHPLAMISLMLDSEIHGLNAGGYHFTNLLLHATTAVLLFLMLRRMTGGMWASAFAAAVFAIHPLRVESVAWVSERKDLLSGLFFVLTLWAYARYAEKSKIPGSKAGRLYGLAVLFYSLGLLSKPTLVTLPFLLLLLDWWPLRRVPNTDFRVSNWTPLFFEKVPLFVLSAVSCVVAVFAQGSAIQTGDGIPLSLRIGNAIYSYSAYLGQMIYPVGLAVYYPHPGSGLAAWKISLALILLAGMTVGFFTLRRRQPYLLVGWLWYLGMLVPMIGIIQVGSFARADRHTYLPQIGLYIALAWAAESLFAGWRNRRVVLGGFSAAILAALFFCARNQASYWRDSESLWAHTIASTPDNWVARNGFGMMLLQKEDVDGAIVDFQETLQVYPNAAAVHYNLANALLKKRDVDGAIAHYREALQLQPGIAEAHYNLGVTLHQKGDFEEAISQYRRALEIRPDYADARINLGNLLFQKGGVDEAITNFHQALKIAPNSAEAHYNLGNALVQKGILSEAIASFHQALQIKPDYLEALNNLAWVLATAPEASLRNGRQAVELAQRANQIAGREDAFILHTLAASYAEAGRFGDAVETAQKAMKLAQAAGRQNLVEQLDDELKRYSAGLPLHQ